MGNYNELWEVIHELQRQRWIKSNNRKIKLDETNQAIDLLKQSQIFKRDKVPNIF
jgi:hypothetical protein